MELKKNVRLLIMNKKITTKKGVKMLVINEFQKLRIDKAQIKLKLITMEKLKFLVLSIIFTSVAIHVNGQVKKDWNNAPLNPTDPLTASRLDSKAPVVGDIVKLNKDWYDSNKILLDPNLFDTIESAKKYNGYYYVKNKAGQVIETVSFFNNKEFKILYQYNKSGLLILKNVVADGKSTSYNYDKKGRLTKAVLTGKSFQYTTNYTYQNKGKILEINEMQYNQDNVLTNHFIYTYRDGLIRSYEEVGQLKSTYDYEFDDQSNWIKRFKNGNYNYPQETQTIIYRNQIKNLNTNSAYVKKTGYKYGLVLRSMDLDVDLKAVSMENDVILYHPLEQEYLIAKDVQPFLVVSNQGKEVTLTSLGKGKPTLNHKNVVLVNGVKIIPIRFQN